MLRSTLLLLIAPFVVNGFGIVNTPTRCNSALFAKSTGTVKWFDTKKGFGFIRPDDGSNDVFVHQTSIQTDGFRSLAEGENVEFETVNDDNGRSKAVDVTGPGGEPVQGAPFRPANEYGEW
mmetsp:Transcript_32502/g.64443  ORF Transcript_32502/g.64443 Transcript_32502/m.64443 type:complete len:121 (-) Transcript_32502:169-531(-)|eukprot:CAMPEP_0194275502 /NCGR_PEP_ID=MMETSP0169-20130528/8325_1 /TAXON_ID=218684 /ORGANISM="Corethron pennatum, Strain L29A3" /LENGTH=120 /DNA_ID=CAMNT_0039018981 /DNA_START=124 /DNA_END=486 /DNA_ORIENTATION=+